jgi:chromosome segregation ATPase
MMRSMSMSLFIHRERGV